MHGAAECIEELPTATAGLPPYIEKVCRVNYEGEFFTLSGSLLESEKAELAAGSRAHARPLPVATKPRRPAGVQAAAAAQQPWRRQPAAAAAEGQSAARAAQADGAAPPRPVAEPPATDGAAQQPEHRKKSKRRDGGDAGECCISACSAAAGLIAGAVLATGKMEKCKRVLMLSDRRRRQWSGQRGETAKEEESKDKQGGGLLGRP